MLPKGLKAKTSGYANERGNTSSLYESSVSSTILLLEVYVFNLHLYLLLVCLLDVVSLGKQESEVPRSECEQPHHSRTHSVYKP